MVVLILFLIMIIGCASATVNTYVVPAINDTKLLPGMQLSTDFLNTNIPVNMFLGERTSVSFAVNSDQQIKNLTAVCSNFTDGGNTISSNVATIRILKSWFQAGYNNWDYLAYNGNYLTPELLLNNSSMVYVVDDNWTQWNVSDPNGANYLYLTTGQWVNISNPMPQDISNTQIQDADHLLPADLPANYNRQYIITFNIPTNTVPGNYTGTITLQNDTTTLKTMTVLLKVLPITLPASPLEYSLYFQASINPAGLNTYSVPENSYISYLQDILLHGITNPTLYPSDDTTLTKELSIRKTLGFNNTYIYYHNSEATPITNYAHYQALFAPYGVTKIFNYGPDESECNISQLLLERANGYGHYNAQISQYLNEYPNLLDLAVEYGNPIQADAATMHKHGNRIFSYGNPQTVPEWPRTWRYNYGLLLWQKDFDGAMPFAYESYTGDAWNDFCDYQWHNRQHMLVYPTVNGQVDTIQWEGLAEGINDVRYIQALKNAIAAKNSPSDPTVQVAQGYLTNLKTSDLSNANLDQVRQDLQTYTLAVEGYGAQVNGSALNSNFLGNITSGIVPFTVQFTDQSIGNPSSWSWNFGDDNTSTAQNPTHTYYTVGTYNVTLTVSNVNGSSTSSIIITATNPIPVANFSVTPTICVAPLTIQFTDTSIGKPVIGIGVLRMEQIAIYRILGISYARSVLKRSYSCGHFL